MSIVRSVGALQGIIAALVQALNGVPVEPFVADLHPGAQRTHRGKIFDREADGFCRGGKAPIAQRLPRTALALGHEQLGWCAVVECHGPAFTSLRRGIELPSHRFIRENIIPGPAAGRPLEPRSRLAGRHESRLSWLSLTTRSCGSSELLMRY